MRITKNGASIGSPDEWFRRAPPRRGLNHWVAGRSAMELARAWCPEDRGATVPPEIAAVLNSHPDFRGSVIQELEPEVLLPFDEIPGEPSNADLAGTGTGPSASFALTVEGKANEPFGNLVRKELRRAAQRIADDIPTRVIARIQQLSEALLPTRVADSLLLGDLRYQLMTATGGLLARARTRQRSSALFIVHEFRSSATNDEKLARNQQDLDRFVHRLSSGRWTQARTGELVGPIHVRGNSFIQAVPLYIAKAQRDLTEGS
jgi:hypothetical protein